VSTFLAEPGPASRDGAFLRAACSIRVHVVPTTTPTYHALREAAEQLRQAALSATPVPPVRAILAPAGAKAAYGVQRLNIEARVRAGDAIVGRKIGLTSAVVQAQLGVTEPDFGTLLRSMQVPHEGTVDSRLLLQPRIEAEIAFELSESITTVPGRPEELVAFIRYARPALEIVDSRIADWNIQIVDTIADNASSGLFVLGTGTLPADLESLTSVTMRLERNGEVVSTGRGSDCLGSPLSSLHWLATAMCAVGQPLHAGDIVLSGALGPMSAVAPGDTFVATFGGADAVSVSFSDKRSS